MSVLPLENSPASPSKRKAAQLETSMNLRALNNKRVSFGKTEVFELPYNSLPEDLETPLSTVLQEINKQNDNIKQSECKIIEANQAIHAILKTLSTGLGISPELNQLDIEHSKNILDQEIAQLSELEAKKNQIFSTITEEEQEITEDLKHLKTQEQLLGSDILSISNETKFCKKQLDVYQKLLKYLGVSVKSNDKPGSFKENIDAQSNDYVITCNRSDFNINSIGPSYLLTPIHDNLKLFIQGSHKICKSQLKYFTYRLIDN
jgi:hypothetical protein